MPVYPHYYAFLPDCYRYVAALVVRDDEAPAYMRNSIGGALCYRDGCVVIWGRI